jgi:transcriptional regulator with GAF, ATPase, and Fis domain
MMRSFRGPAPPAVPSATECEPMPGIIGNSAALMDVLAMVRTVAPTDATVLITGESGTGKELVAHALHDLSDRHSNGFITMNCAVFSKRAHRVIETIPPSTMDVLPPYR